MDSEGGDHGAGRYDVSEDRRSVRTLAMFGRSPSKAIKVEVFAKTDLGRTRDHNEDHFLVADLTRRDASLKPAVRTHEIGERGSLFVVADGMGGAAAGEVASEMATETIYEQMVNAWGSASERRAREGSGGVSRGRARSLSCAVAGRLERRRTRKGQQGTRAGTE